MITQDTLLKLLDLCKEGIELFSVRHSNKARRIIFKSSIRTGFEVVLPVLHEDNWVLEIVAERKSKIESHISEIRESRRELKPQSIELPTTGHSWRVTYKDFNDKKPVVTTETPTTLQIPEYREDVFHVPKLLQKWLHERALEYLPKRLENLSTTYGIHYNKVRIKRQKTLWGSCSSKRNINLNRNLMLMPLDVSDYVLHHELAHLKVLNHSSGFWEELERLLPNYKDSLIKLKYLQKRRIPQWALI